MLSLLNHWKLFILLGSLLLNGLLYHQITRLDDKLQLCNANDAKKQVAIDLANEMKADLTKQLLVREQEAAKAHVETTKRMEQLNKAKIPDDCNQAIQWGIARVHSLKFDWQNNIP